MKIEKRRFCVKYTHAGRDEHSRWEVSKKTSFFDTDDGFYNFLNKIDLNPHMYTFIDAFEVSFNCIDPRRVEMMKKVYNKKKEDERILRAAEIIRIKNKIRNSLTLAEYKVAADAKII